ncbi:MAG: NUDIX hydrolase [Myxococcota bacterium]
MSDPGVEEIGRGRFLRLVSRGGWEYAERIGRPGVVVIVAVTPDDALVLTEQHRPAVNAHVIDLPAGLAGDEPGRSDEPLAQAARRELEEETGWSCDRVEPVLSGPPSPGTTSEILSFFRAHALRRTGPGGGVGNESIQVHEIPVDEVRAWLADAAAPGRLVDPKVHVALSLLRR